MRTLAVLVALAAIQIAPPAAAADAPVERPLTLVNLKTGPQSGKLSKEQNDEVFAGHFSNMQRMADEGQLLIAGPYGTKRHDAGLRGLFILDTSDRGKARQWASTDPPTRAGVFRMEFLDLATSAPLRAALEAEAAWRKDLEAKGTPPKMTEGMRTFVVLTADNADVAYRLFGPLRSAEGGVFLLGRLEGARALVVLDAESLAKAKERFRPQLVNLGRHDLDEWFATDQIARLNELAR